MQKIRHTKKKENMILKSKTEEKRRVVIFGTGLYYQNRKHTLEKENIIAFLDNSQEKQGMFLGSVPIYHPAKAVEMEFDFIILMLGQKFIDDVYQQLTDIGIEKEKVITYPQYLSLCENKYLMINSNSAFYNKRKSVLLVSHELTNTGAPIVLLYLAEVLKKNGYFPVIACKEEGELKESIISADIPVVIVPDMNKNNRFVWEWVNSFDLIILNTLCLGVLVKELCDSKQKVFWWLHEAENEYEMCEEKNLPKEIGSNVSVFAVGERAVSAHKKYTGNDRVSNLLYGLPDFRSSLPKERYGKLVFAIVGTIHGRKGQDIFVDAIQYLSDNDRKNAEFWVIGRMVEQDIYDHVIAMAEEYEEIKVLGALPPHKMQKIYEDIDIVVSPSRFDPMPVVLTEGMMNHKVCIASEMTGTAALISNKENGLICKLDAMDLAEQMTWILNNRQKLKEIGENARILYEQKFSMTAFEKNILTILEHQ